jgi:ferredoxin-NADP reductase
MSDPLSTPILAADWLTHNVRRFRLAKPAGWAYEPGQAIDLAIDAPDWREQVRPFTFTSLPDDDALELVIKVYPDHGGVTHQLGRIEVGERVLMGEPFTAIEYGGPGLFVAGGSGITPFLAQLRHLARQGGLDGHRLIFSNHRWGDVILREELESLLGDNLFLTLTREERAGVRHGRIDERLLREAGAHEAERVYLCGPDGLVEEIGGRLRGLGRPTEALIA